MLGVYVHAHCVSVKLAHSHKVQLTKAWNATQDLHPAAPPQRSICVNSTEASDQNKGAFALQNARLQLAVTSGFEHRWHLGS